MRSTSLEFAANSGSGATMSPFGSSTCLYSILNSATVDMGELCQGLRCGASGTVPAREIKLCLHLDEPARGALEFAVPPPSLVQISRRRRGRHDHLDAAVVE